MAQSQVVTNEGIEELVKRWHGTTATKLTSICCMTDSGACTAAVTDSNTTPADDLCTTNGLSIVDITAASVVLATLSTDGDAIDFDHIFTASASKNVSGIVVKNDDNAVVFVSCCFNAVLAMEENDTLTIDGQVSIDQAA